MSELSVRTRVALPVRRKKREDSLTRTTRKAPSRIARLLALAYHLERQVEEGELSDCAEAARRLGISRARVAQVLGLLSLSARIQERILSGELVTSERRLRPALKELCWKAQEEVVEERNRE